MKTGQIKQKDFQAHITGANLRHLREQLGAMQGRAMSQAEFGRELCLATNPHARPADWYTRQYVSAMESGKPGFAITPQIETAYWLLLGNLDGVVPGALALHEVTVLISIEGQIPPNTYIPMSARTTKCALPGCPVVFLKTNPGQKYHSATCRDRAAEMREKNKQT